MSGISTKACEQQGWHCVPSLRRRMRRCSAALTQVSTSRDLDEGAKPTLLAVPAASSRESQRYRRRQKSSPQHMVRQRGLHINRVDTEALKNYGVDDNCTSVELLADPSAAQRARSISGSSSASRILCRRGLNVQWPFSQLILCGAKSIEVRSYALGHRCIAKAGEEVWIVETRGPCASASTNAVVQDAAIAPRRQEAHIVGCVTFSG